MSSDSSSERRKQVTIYSSFFCPGGQKGNGAYGVVLQFGQHEKDLAGGFEATTANRMALLGAAAGLEALTQECRVRLVSPSEYLVSNLVGGHAARWRRNSWWLSANKRAQNVDLWERVLGACERHDVRAELPASAETIARCETLARERLEAGDHLTDVGYVADPEHAESRSCMQEGDPCRKCQTPLVKKVPRKRKRIRPTYFEYYLYCPQCATQYMIESARRSAEGADAPELGLTWESGDPDSGDPDSGDPDA